MSYCSHIYCDICYKKDKNEKNEKGDNIFYNIDTSKRCAEQNKRLIIICPCCNIETNFLYNPNFKSKCNKCALTFIGHMIGCCCHAICVSCYYQAKIRQI